MHKGGHAILYHVDQWMGGCCMGKGSGYGVDMHGAGGVGTANAVAAVAKAASGERRSGNALRKREMCCLAGWCAVETPAPARPPTGSPFPGSTW